MQNNCMNVVRDKILEKVIKSGFSGTDILVCVVRLNLVLKLTDKNVCAIIEEILSSTEAENINSVRGFNTPQQRVHAALRAFQNKYTRRLLPARSVECSELSLWFLP